MSKIIPNTIHSSVDKLISLDRIQQQKKIPAPSQTKFSNPSTTNPLADLLSLARQAEIAREQFKKRS